MPNVTQGSAVELTFYVESPFGIPANAASAELRWKMGAHGEETTVTTYTNTTVGTYVFTITPDKGGILYAEFRATDPDYREMYQVAVEGSQFDD